MILKIQDCINGVGPINKIMIMLPSEEMLMYENVEYIEYDEDADALIIKVDGALAVYSIGTIINFTIEEKKEENDETEIISILDKNSDQEEKIIKLKT